MRLSKTGNITVKAIPCGWGTYRSLSDGQGRKKMSEPFELRRLRSGRGGPVIIPPLKVRMVFRQDGNERGRDWKKRVNQNISDTFIVR